MLSTYMSHLANSFLVTRVLFMIFSFKFNVNYF